MAISIPTQIDRYYTTLDFFYIIGYYDITAVKTL